MRNLKQASIRLLPPWRDSTRPGGGGRGRSAGSAGVSPASFESRFALRDSPPGRRRSQGFTMIEIALCLAIIGFALVAIIAVLPRGLDVEKKNREETIIGQDAQMWMDAIRSGARGYDDLTNYVLSITNYWTVFRNVGTSTVIPPWNVDATQTKTGIDWYTPTDSSFGPQYNLNNVSEIIGLLSTPKWIETQNAGIYRSNYVVAYVRAFSGAEVNKFPQTNTTILADALVYRMIVENFPYVPVDTNSFCTNCPATNGLTASQIVDRMNEEYAEEMLQTNLHDLRLRFRYPVLPSGEIPSYGLATFREMAGGQMTNYFPSGTLNTGPQLFFIEPSAFAQLIPNPNAGSRPPPQL